MRGAGADVAVFVINGEAHRLCRDLELCERRVQARTVAAWRAERAVFQAHGGAPEIGDAGVAG